MDRVAQASRADDQAYALPQCLPTESDSLEIEACALRYVVGPEASVQCAELVRCEPELLASWDSPMLRLPAPRFWIEWFSEPAEGGARMQKTGCIVEADEGLRTGTLRPYWINANGDAERLPGCVRFDLDHPFETLGRDRFRLRHGEFVHLNAILGHTALELEPNWMRRVRAQALYPARQLVEHHAQSAWYSLPCVLAFSALLNSENAVDQQASALRELNASRRRRNRRPLLEHIEVNLALGGAGAREAGERLGGGGARAMPRLHLVRGHPVSRGGKTFWRSPHLRGSAEAPILSKTVRVVAGASADRIKRAAR